MNARFRDLVAAEWLKLWTLRSTYWAMGILAFFSIGSSVDSAWADYRNWPTYSAGMQAFFVPTQDAFPRAVYFFVMLLSGTIGALGLTGEYGTGLIRTTFAAVPARHAVVAAKVVVLTGVMTALGAVIAGTSFWLSQAILSGRHAGWSLTHPTAVPALVASALLVPVSALVGMAVGAVLRHTAPSVVTTVVLLLLLPLFVNSPRRWAQDIQHAMPEPAWARLVEGHPEMLAQQPYPATVAGSWTTLAVWALAAVGLAAVVVHRRDP